MKVASGETAVVGVKNYGGSDSSLSNGGVSGNWINKKLTFTTGSSNTSAIIYFNKTSMGVGYVYGDDFGVVINKDASVDNPGFETGSMSPWEHWSNTETVVGNNQHSGDKAVQFSAGVDAGFAQTVYGLLPNTSYTLTGWCKIASGDVVSLGVMDYGGNAIMQQFTNTSYQQQSITFTTGSSSSSATIFIYKPSGSGSSYCDDFSLTKN